MNQAGDGSATTSICAFIVAILCFALLPSSTAHHSNNDSVHSSFEFDQEQGMTTAGTVSISGMSHHPLRNASWYLFDLADTTTPLEQGDYLTAVIPQPNGFKWNLSFDASTYDCTCVVEIHVPSNTNPNRVDLHSFFVFLGDENHVPVLHHANFDFINTQELNENVSNQDSTEAQHHSNQQLHEYPLQVLDNTTVEFRIINPEGASNDSVLKADVCQAPFGICVEDSVTMTLNSQRESGVISVSLNSSLVGGQEGIWKFSISAQDSLLRTSDSITMMFIHDNTPPQVRINMEANAYERQLISVFSEGIDGYAGSSVTETWSLTLPNGSVRAPLDGEIVNSGHLVFNLSQSGVYSLELTLRDEAGHTNTTITNFTVMNELPKAIVTVDGLTTVYGQEIRMKQGANWTIDGTQSSDNEPIAYLWIIDETTSIRGVDMLVPTDFSSTGTFSVELIVFDDDGATNSTLISLVITGSSESVSGDNNIALPIIGFVILAVIIACLVSWVNRKPSSALPKWSATNPSIHHEEPIEDNNDDATIEEASAGG